jgi:prepilin-type N-terminal cleavage/methylation domain-containing protein
MNKTRGYTLVEVIIAMIIFAINMLFAITFFTYGNQSRVRSEETNYALNIARDEIETLKSKNYESITVTASTPVSRKFEDDIQYNYWVGVSEINGSEGKYKIIRATVTWTKSEPKSISLSTVVSPEFY